MDRVAQGREAKTWEIHAAKAWSRNIRSHTSLAKESLPSESTDPDGKKAQQNFDGERQRPAIDKSNNLAKEKGKYIKGKGNKPQTKGKRKSKYKGK